MADVYLRAICQALLEQTGDVKPKSQRHGSQLLEQLTLLRLIIENTGIYLHEIQNKLRHLFGVTVSVPTIY